MPPPASLPPPPPVPPPSTSLVSHKGKAKELDPEAAAATASGIRLKRLEDGLGCRCCDFVAHSRRELLKHVQKTGHTSVRRDLPDGLYYIEPERARDKEKEKVERKQQVAAIARGRNRQRD